MMAGSLAATGPLGILDIVSGNTKPREFRIPELTDQERSRATRYGVMSGIAAGSRSGLLGGIMGAMLGGRQGREKELYDKYLKMRLENPTYGDEETDRLMAQRYGGEGYIRPPTPTQPQRPIEHTRYIRGDQGQLLGQSGFVDPGSMQFTPSGDPFRPIELSRSGSRGQASDARKGSEIRAAREWARSFARSDPDRWRTIRRGSPRGVSAMELEWIDLLTKRDPEESEATYQRWLQDLERLGQEPAAAPVSPEATGPGLPARAAGWVGQTARGVLDRISGIGEGQSNEGAAAENASALRKRLVEQGLLPPD